MLLMEMWFHYKPQVINSYSILCKFVRNVMNTTMSTMESDKLFMNSRKAYIWCLPTIHYKLIQWRMHGCYLSPFGMWTHVSIYTLNNLLQILQQACLVCRLPHCGFAYSQSYLCSTTQEATAVHVSHSISTYILSMWNVPWMYYSQFTELLVALISTSGRVDVCAHEEPEYKKKTKEISLLQK